MTLADLYDDYENKLHRFAMQLTRDALDSDDLVQETFIRAMPHLELLKQLDTHQCRAWLSRTLKNLFLDKQKQRQRQAVLVENLMREISESHHTFSNDTEPNPFDFVPEQYREVVEMRYVLGMNSREIGQELGLPAATVRSRLHLAMQALRRKKSRLR
ncbi:MAG: RNA polymerase sigma factor [Candidatus Latescibacteria bacterium]|jgi:RNA polymerase sigma-70 factor, ECF subfamily|nr:RNA polymerase sigma factor [Candidatus Latescibacterota bacterium]MBT4136733.1 RNA polymerase sigma factor [Candidatus Latescibacterota bacterium]MBT5830922.1 RNA polymerase sigma factor [Candidatus Latescibacterota bacterium]